MAMENLLDQLMHLGRLGEATLAAVGPGEAALVGLDDEHSSSAQRRDVGGRCRVFPHLGVHRGDHDHRAAGREQHVGQQVVGHAMGGLGHQVGGGRGHDHQVGALTDPNVRHLVGIAHRV